MPFSSGLAPRIFDGGCDFFQGHHPEHAGSGTEDGIECILWQCAETGDDLTAFSCRSAAGSVVTPLEPLDGSGNRK